MASPEQSKNVSEALSKAEGRVNRSQMDVSVNTKMQIFDADKAIRDTIASYKEMGIYEDVKKEYGEMQMDQKETPEVVLANLTFQFDRLEATESASAAEQIRAVSYLASQKLTELKKELTSSAEETMEFAAKVEAERQKFLPEYNFDPSNISETVRSVGEILGQEPNVEKLQGYELENDLLLSELRGPSNSKKYFAASTEFRQLTGGLSLEDIKPRVAEALRQTAEEIKVNPEKARIKFGEAFRGAVDTFKVLNDVLSNALFSVNHSSLETSASERTESLGEGDLLSEEEMAIMLEIALNGAKDKSYLEQLFDANAALEYVTGKKPEDLSVAERHALALAQGLGQGTAGLINFGIHVGHGLMHPGTAVIELYKIVSGAGAALLKPSTYQNIARVAKYGWENTSALEKSLLITQITAEIVGPGLLTAGVGSAAGAMGKSFEKMSKLARVGGLAVEAVEIAKLANPLLRNFPRLAEYGTKGVEIAKGIGERVGELKHHAEHVIHRMHEAESAIHKAEVAGKYTVKASGQAERDLAVENLPVFKEIVDTTYDANTAIANASALGLELTDVATVRTGLKELGVLKTEVVNSSPVQG